MMAQPDFLACTGMARIQLTFSIGHQRFTLAASFSTDIMSSMQGSRSAIHTLRAPQKSALKQQAASQTAPQAAVPAREQLTGPAKRRRTEQAAASACAPAAAVGARAESKRIQLAQHSQKAPATPTAHAKRKAAGPGAGGPCWHASHPADGRS